MGIVKLILRLMILCFSVWDLYLIFKPFLQYAEIGVAANQMEYGITAIGVTLFIMLLSYINAVSYTHLQKKSMRQSYWNIR